MRVGLNLLYLIPGVVGGVQTYAEGLLRGLSELPDDTDYSVFLNRESAGLELPNSPRFHRVVLPVHARSRLLRYAWEQGWLPKLAESHRIDVLHSLGYVGPLSAPCATVVTVHDLNFIRLAAQMPVWRRVVLSGFSKACALRADQVITVSRFSHAEICSELGLHPGRVTVVYHGPPDGGCELVSAPAGESLGLPARYVTAFTGGGMPHKNIDRLVQAFREACRDLPHELVLIGCMPRALAGALGSRVRLTGYLPASGVRQVLRNAELFVLPSLFEGFGFPVLEAQRAGVPVACSDAASLPEVGGLAARYFSPLSALDMAAAIRSTLLEVALRQELLREGPRNVARFSWRETARLTRQVYDVAYARHAGGKARAA